MSPREHAGAETGTIREARDDADTGGNGTGGHGAIFTLELPVEQGKLCSEEL